MGFTCQSPSRASEIPTTFAVLFFLSFLTVFFVSCSNHDTEVYEYGQFPSITVFDGKSDAVRIEYLKRKKLAEAENASIEDVSLLAVFFHANGFYHEALELYPYLMEVDEGNPRWPYFFSRIKQDLGDLQLAVEFLDRSIELDSNYALSYWRKGELLQKQGAVEEASNAYERCLEIEPQHAYALLGLGRVAVKQADWKRAESLLNRAIEAKPDLASAYFMLSSVYQNTGNPLLADKARMFGGSHGRYMNPEDEWLDSIHEHCFDFYQLTVLADYYVSVFHPKEAVHYYEKALSIDPEHLETNVHLALQYFELDQRSKGVDILRNALKYDPRSELLYSELLREAVVSGDKKDKLSLIREAGKQCPNSALISYLSARVYELVHEAALAEDAYMKSLDIDPNSAQTLKGVCEFYLSARQFEKAGTYLIQLSEMEQSDELWALRYRFYSEQQRFDDGISFFQSLEEPLVGKKYLILLWIDKGNDLTVQNNTIGAEKAFKRALEMDPTNENAIEGFVNALMRAGFDGSAQKFLRNKIESSPEAAISYALLAQAYAKAGDIQKGLNVLDRGLEITRSTHQSEAHQKLVDVKKVLEGI